MKRKTILSFLTGAALLCSMPSCMNLDEEVYDKLPAENFGNTTTEINALVGTVYNTLKKYSGDYMILAENSGSSTVNVTRNGGDWYDGGQYREVYMHTWTANTSCVKSCWSIGSECIGTCNATIEVLKNSTLLSDAEKTSKVAESRGVRAFWIYSMMDFFGNIPLVVDYNDKELPTCKSRQEVFDWLITELNALATEAPDYDTKKYGTFTKGTAYTILAKMYQNAEAWGVNISENANSKVIEYCDKVMAMPYILEPNWKTNFDPNNNTSKEAIFAASYSSTDTEDQNVLYRRTLHYKQGLALGASISVWNGICAQPDYVKLFNEDDPRYEGTYLIGQQYDISTGEKIITDENRPLDYTVDISIIPGSELDGTKWGAVYQDQGARCQKWTYEKSLSTAMENDFHLFRLADIYLMKAEALLRSGGSVAEATNLVNAIRERAYGNNTHNYSTITLKEVQLERRLELAWEGFSRQDDIRFGCFTKGMWTESNCERKTDDYLKIFPVSQDAWQTNPNLVQNPGYASF